MPPRFDPGRGEVACVPRYCIRSAKKERIRGRGHRRHELLDDRDVEKGEEDPEREDQVELVVVRVQNRIEELVRKSRDNAKVLVVWRLGRGVGVEQGREGQ